MTKLDWTKAKLSEPDPARITDVGDYGVLPDRLDPRYAAKKKAKKKKKVNQVASAKQQKRARSKLRKKRRQQEGLAQSFADAIEARRQARLAGLLPFPKNNRRRLVKPKDKGGA